MTSFLAGAAAGIGAVVVFILVGSVLDWLFPESAELPMPRPVQPEPTRGPPTEVYTRPAIRFDTCPECWGDRVILDGIPTCIDCPVPYSLSATSPDLEVPSLTEFGF